MAKLTQEHLDFLERHAISAEGVFDATGMGYAEYKQYMKENGLLLAYGVTPCQNAGHTLRTRYNHCVMCDPSKIAYVKRRRTPGFVYIAISSKEKLVKIGCAKDHQKRISTLNRQNYGNISDWQLAAYFYHENMGEAEHNIQKGFVSYQELRAFSKDGEMVQASEIYRINISRVLGRIDELGYDLEYINCDLIERCFEEKVKSANKTISCIQKPQDEIITSSKDNHQLNTNGVDILIKPKLNLSNVIKPMAVDRSRVEPDDKLNDALIHDTAIVSSALTHTEAITEPNLLSASCIKNSYDVDAIKKDDCEKGSVFEVRGRLRRLSYIVISFLLLMVTGFLMVSMYAISNSYSILVFLSWFVGMAFQAFFAAKRLQDANIHAGWAVVAFIPYLCVLGWLFLLFVPGTKGANRFGENPRT